MHKIRHIRQTALFLALAVWLCSFCNVFAASPAQLTVGSTTAARNQTVEIPVSLENSGNLSGIHFTITYDATCLSYVEGPLQTGMGATSPVIYNDAAQGILHYAWDCADGDIEINGTFVVFQFKVAASVAAGEIPLSVKVEEAFRLRVENGKLKNESVAVSVTHGKITVAVADAAVENTIAAIAQIGTVAYDVTTQNRINVATNLYLALNFLQRQQVTNFADLLAAQEEYYALKAEYEKAAAISEAATWHNTHATILSRTVETLTLSDRQAVEQALADYTQLSNAAKAEAIGDKNHLNILNDYFTVLEMEKDEAEREAQLLAEAKVLAEDFRKTYASFLTLTTDQLVSAHSAGITAALTDLDGLSLINPKVSAMLETERKHLELLNVALEEVIKNENPEESSAILAANNFRRTFGWVLSLLPEDVTEEDVIDIAVAAAYFDTLDEETQEQLKSEKALLDRLISAIENLPVDDEVIIKPVVEAPSEPGDLIEIPESEYPKAQVKTVRVLTRQPLNPTIWFLLGIFCLCTLAVIALWISYIKLKKGKEMDNICSSSQA